LTYVLFFVFDTDLSLDVEFSTWLQPLSSVSIYTQQNTKVDIQQFEATTDRRHTPKLLQR